MIWESIRCALSKVRIANKLAFFRPELTITFASNFWVRVVDAFVESLDLGELGFERTIAASTGRPGFRAADMLRLYVWGYLNQVRSSRHLERACVRDLEALWLNVSS